MPIAEVGHAETFSSGSSGSPSTSLPSGVGAGDFIVSYIESYAFTTISCDSGWTQTVNVKNGTSGARLVACDTVASIDQSAPQARVNPPTQVSMVTVAFSGVNDTDPVDASAAQTWIGVTGRDDQHRRLHARPRSGEQRVEVRRRCTRGRRPRGDRQQ